MTRPSAPRNAASSRCTNHEGESLRCLAIDLGDKRTGLAIGDDETGHVFPLEVLHVPIADRNGEALLDALVRAAKDHGATDLVVGLPLNMDDSEGPRARLARDIAAKLRARTGLMAHLQDERLSSEEAEWALRGSERTRKEKKNVRDAIAAANFLRDFLSSRRRAHDPHDDEAAS